jgi:hypothetical protein
MNLDDPYLSNLDPGVLKDTVCIEDGYDLVPYRNSSGSVRTLGSSRTDGNRSVRSTKPRERYTQKNDDDKVGAKKFAAFLDATRMDYVQMGPILEDYKDKGRTDFEQQLARINHRYNLMYGSSAPKLSNYKIEAVHPSFAPLMRGESKGIRLRTCLEVLRCAENRLTFSTARPLSVTGKGLRQVH